MFLKKKNRDVYPTLVVCVRISVVFILSCLCILINITVFQKKKTFFNNLLIIIERYLGLYSICTFVIPYPSPTPFLFVIYQILSIIYSILFSFLFLSFRRFCSWSHKSLMITSFWYYSCFDFMPKKNGPFLKENCTTIFISSLI